MATYGLWEVILLGGLLLLMGGVGVFLGVVRHKQDKGVNKMHP